LRRLPRRDISSGIYAPGWTPWTSQWKRRCAARLDCLGGRARSTAEAYPPRVDEIVLEEFGNEQKVRVGGLVQLTVRVKPAQKARKGRNPATGEEITIAAKPASVDLPARPLVEAKPALPSVQKARRRLAGDSPPDIGLSAGGPRSDPPSVGRLGLPASGRKQPGPAPTGRLLSQITR
jgi:nucleoid DNA-binding protein